MKRKFIKSLFLASLVAAFFVITSYVSQEEASALPPFARKYKTSCTMCHVVVPKLNSFGRAFKRNGYIWPGGAGEENAAQDAPIKQLDGWGKGTISSHAPLGALGEFEVATSGDAMDTGSGKSAFDMISVFEIFWGGSTGNHGFFAILVAGDAEVNAPGGGTEFATTFEALQIQFNDIVKDMVNIKVGSLLTGPASLDSLFMIAFSPTGWRSGPSALGVLGGEVSDGDTVGGQGVSIEINGTIANMVYYGIGVASGDIPQGDANDEKTIYAFVEAKIGGMKMIGDATGGKFYEDNHALIRASYTMQKPNVTQTAHVITLLIEAWFKQIQTDVFVSYTSENNGLGQRVTVGGTEYNLSSAQTLRLHVGVGAILADAKFNPGIKFDMTMRMGGYVDMWTDQMKGKVAGTFGGALGGDQAATLGDAATDMWIHVGFSSMMSANVIHWVGARLGLGGAYGQGGRLDSAKKQDANGAWVDPSMLSVLEYKLLYAF